VFAVAGDVWGSKWFFNFIAVKFYQKSFWEFPNNLWEVREFGDNFPEMSQVDPIVDPNQTPTRVLPFLRQLCPVPWPPSFSV